jgi:hypothetical protein
MAYDVRAPQVGVSAGCQQHQARVEVDRRAVTGREAATASVTGQIIQPVNAGSSSAREMIFSLADHLLGRSLISASRTARARSDSAIPGRLAATARVAVYGRRGATLLKTSASASTQSTLIN